MYKNVIKVIRKFCAKNYNNAGSCACPLSDGYDCLLDSYPISWDLRKIRNRLKAKVARRSTSPNNQMDAIALVNRAYELSHELGHLQLAKVLLKLKNVIVAQRHH